MAWTFIDPLALAFILKYSIFETRKEKAGLENVFKQKNKIMKTKINYTTNITINKKTCKYLPMLHVHITIITYMEKNETKLSKTLIGNNIEIMLIKNIKQKLYFLKRKN